MHNCIYTCVIIALLLITVLEGTLKSIWKEWGSWGGCSKSCEEGYQERHRQCPGPFHCPGWSVDVQTCKMFCSITAWNSWGSWGQCGSVHGVCQPLKRRTRQCIQNGVQVSDSQCGGGGSQQTYACKMTRICLENIGESTANHAANCKLTSTGQEYSGNISVTINNTLCQRWDSSFPHTTWHCLTDANFVDGSIARAENYCRNTLGDCGNETYPWCYTMDPDIRWEYCDIRSCGATYGPNCKTSATGAEYRGTVSTTETGKACQYWITDFPHYHEKENADMVDDFISDSANYCRNPDDEDRPWCYTMDEDVRWELCNIPDC